MEDLRVSHDIRLLGAVLRGCGAFRLVGYMTRTYCAWEELRMPGVEPGSQAWEACMMPLHYMRGDNNVGLNNGHYQYQLQVMSAQICPQTRIVPSISFGLSGTIDCRFESWPVNFLPQ